MVPNELDSETAALVIINDTAGMITTVSYKLVQEAKFNLRVDGCGTHEAIAAIRAIRVSTANNEWFIDNLLVAYSSKILKHRRRALSRTTYIVRCVTEGLAGLTVETTPGILGPKCTCASGKRIGWCTEGLLADEEGHPDDVGNDEDGEKPWAGEVPSYVSKTRFYINAEA
jgi:hypothetical protein